MALANAINFSKKVAIIENPKNYDVNDMIK